MSFPESKKEILEELEFYGYEPSDDQLRRWRKLGLLPEPIGREAYGQGGGSDVFYPAGTTEWTLELLRLRQEFRRLESVGWHLWGRGYPVVRFAREGMVSFFESLDPEEIITALMQGIPPDQLLAMATRLPEVGIEISVEAVARWPTELAARAKAAPDQLLIRLRDEARDPWRRIWRAISNLDPSLPPSVFFWWFALRTSDGLVSQEVNEWVESDALEAFLTEFAEDYPETIEQLRELVARYE